MPIKQVRVTSPLNNTVHPETDAEVVLINDTGELFAATEVEGALQELGAAKHTHSNKTILDNTTASFTTAAETKLSGIAAGAEVNVQADWNETNNTSDAYIKNKPTIPSQYTDELAQDAVGIILINTDSINLSYDDVLPAIRADVNFGTTATTVAAGNHTHDIIKNATENNAKVEATSAGVVITRNINDGNTTLRVNKQQGTGSIQSWELGGISKASITTSGTFISENNLIANGGNVYSTNFSNKTSSDNSVFIANDAGAVIQRNIADANPALKVNQANGSSTGDIVRFQFGGVDKVRIFNSGQLIAGNGVFTPTISNPATGGYGVIYLNNSGPVIARDTADANSSLIVNNVNASNTGDIAKFQFGGVDKVRILNSGSIAGEAAYFTAVINKATGSNSRLDLNDTGSVISRNVADANTALVVNQVNASSTGKILDLQFGGVSKTYVTTYGDLNTNFVYSPGLANKTASANSTIYAQITGTLIYRDVADANSALTVNQQNASSTGKIVDFQFGGTSKASIAYDGTIKGSYLALGTFANGAIYLNTNIMTLQRNIADANPAFVINQQNASSTGNITDFQFNGTQKAYIDTTGNIYSANAFRTNVGIRNHNNINNSLVNTADAGTKIERNVADANPALIVNQQSSTSTGNILDLKYAGTSKAYFTKNGSLGIGKYVYNVANTLIGATVTEILIKTGVPFVSSSYMNTYHIKGYAYSAGAPIEFKISHYVYSGAFWSTGIVSLGSWRPTVKLFTYLVDTVKYIGIALIGNIYYPQFSIDYQAEMGPLYTTGWTIEDNRADINIYNMPDTDVVTVPYKSTFSASINGVAFDGINNITITEGTTQATGDSSTKLATTQFVNNEIANDAILKTGGTLSGTLQSTAANSFIGKLSTYKSWIFHHPNSNEFIFAPSTAVDGTTGDWTNQIVLGDGSTVTAKRFISNIATGTAPLSISSTTLVNNLNADLLDGNEASAFATSSHSHGNITNGGAITATAVTPTNTDYILISDTSASGAIERGIQIGSGTTTYLRNDGTWATPPDTNTTYSAGNGLGLSGTTFSLDTPGTLTTTTTNAVTADSHTHAITTTTTGAASTIVATDSNSIISASSFSGVNQNVNTIRSNLGTPSVEEMALFHGQFTNKFRFIAPTLQEESIDGINWVESTRASTNQLKDLVIGEGQAGASITAIPTGTVGTYGGYRLTWDVYSYIGYVFLNHFYSYNSTNGNNVTFLIEKYHNTNGWETATSGTATNWPGHISIKHSSIPYSNSVSQYSKVRITFSTTHNANTNSFDLYSIEWFGGYPAGKRNAETYDRNKNVTFPASLNATTLAATAATGTAPLTITSTTKVINLNVDKLDDQEGSYYTNTDNHTSGTTNKVYTATEQTKLAGIEAGAEVNNISDTNATDLTDGGDTTLHTHALNTGTGDLMVSNRQLSVGTVTSNLLAFKTNNTTGGYFGTGGDLNLNQNLYMLPSKAISNANSLNNAKIELQDTGSVISRNIADANPALKVNQQNASSTGNILDLQFNGTQQAYVNKDGRIHTREGLSNYASSNNSNIRVTDAGTTITRNVADTNSVLTVDNVHASSSGYLLNLKTQGVTKAFVSREGVFYGSGLFNVVASSNSKIEAGLNGAVLTRDVADANPTLKVNQQNASSTGSIQDWQFGGTQKATLNKDGRLGLTTGVVALSSANDCFIQFTTNGTIISRNQADAQTALRVNQQNASSTGKILDLQFGGLSKASIDKEGDIWARKVMADITGVITESAFKTSATTGDGATAGVIIDSDSARFFNSTSSIPVTEISTISGAITSTLGTFTGAIFQTNTGVGPTQAGVQFSESGIVAYNGTLASPTVTIDNEGQFKLIGNEGGSLQWSSDSLDILGDINLTVPGKVSAQSVNSLFTRPMIYSGATAPSFEAGESAANNSLWFTDNLNTINIWDGQNWVETRPAAKAEMIRLATAVDSTILGAGADSIKTKLDTVIADLNTDEANLAALKDYYGYTETSLTIGKAESPAQILINQELKNSVMTPYVSITDGAEEVIKVQSNWATVNNLTVVNTAYIANHKVTKLTGSSTVSVFQPI